MYCDIVWKYCICVDQYKHHTPTLPVYFRVYNDTTIIISLVCQTFACKIGKSEDISIPTFMTLPKSGKDLSDCSVQYHMHNGGSRILQCFLHETSSGRIGFKLLKCSLKRSRKTYLLPIYRSHRC